MRSPSGVDEAQTSPQGLFWHYILQGGTSTKGKPRTIHLGDRAFRAGMLIRRPSANGSPLKVAILCSAKQYKSDRQLDTGAPRGPAARRPDATASTSDGCGRRGTDQGGDTSAPGNRRAAACTPRGARRAPHPAPHEQAAEGMARCGGAAVFCTSSDGAPSAAPEA